MGLRILIVHYLDNYQYCEFTILNIISKIISPFVSHRSSKKFLRWLKELMIIGIGKNNMNLELDEKIVLVTGGTSGIGLAIVKSFLEEMLVLSF